MEGRIGGMERRDVAKRGKNEEKIGRGKLPFLPLYLFPPPSVTLFFPLL